MGSAANQVCVQESASLDVITHAVFVYIDIYYNRLHSSLA